MIDKATVQKIKDTADIVEVVGDYVHLIRRGGNYMGLCPFHNERTPSFSVNRRKNFCYCFSCKKGGSPVNFIMEKEGLSYHEALLHLARRYGIKVEERELTDEERRRQSERESMLVANEWAMRLMEHDLTETDEGRDVGLSYLQGRGVTDEAIAAFHLGYALDRGSHLTGSALKAGYPLDVFKQLGLVGTSQQGRDYDRFRGRVIFPILNTSGKVIAFGGRDLKGGLAKYQLSRIGTLQEEQRAVRHLSGALGYRTRGQVLPCGRLHGRDRHVAVWHEKCGGLFRNCAHRRPDSAYPSVYRQHHADLRRRCSRSQGVSARYRHAPLPQDECQDAPSAA